jgi:peptidoglycan/xylan/chitin deacetylase (PgdA/CDA1 family)
MTSRSAILTWHSIDNSGSAISTPPEVFLRQMEFLAGSGMPVVALDEVLVTPGSVALTFDDGFRNLLDCAIPALDRYGFPATIFVVGGYCGGRNNWPSQPGGTVPDLPLLAWDHFREFPRAISPGVHTMTHPRLDLLTPEACERELRECRDLLEQRFSRPARWLAYPYGTSNAGVREIARKFFDLAVGVSLRFLPTGGDVMELPRIDTYYLRDRFPLDHLFTAEGAAYIGLRRLMREARQRILQ